MFPGGNAGVARHIVKSLIPDAIPGPATLGVRVADAGGFRGSGSSRTLAHPAAHHGDFGSHEAGAVQVVYTHEGKLASVRARSVDRGWRKLDREAYREGSAGAHRDAYAQFYRAPCLMANVAVRNWRFLYKLGISECQWFEGIGNYTAVRKLATFGAVSPTLSPDSPVVLTLKILFSNPQLPIGEQVSKRPHGTDWNALSRLREDEFGSNSHDVRRAWDSMRGAISPV